MLLDFRRDEAEASMKQELSRKQQLLRASAEGQAVKHFKGEGALTFISPSIDHSDPVSHYYAAALSMQ